MNNEKSYLKSFISFTIIALAIILSWNSARAAVNLPNMTVQDSLNFISTQSFSVPETGELKINVKIKLNNPGPQTSYRLQLVKGTRTIVAVKNVYANSSSYKTVELKFNLNSCAYTGLYKIRIKVNNPVSPSRTATAVFPPFEPPNPLKKRCNKSKVKNGQTVANLRIPEKHFGFLSGILRDFQKTREPRFYLRQI